MKSSEEKFLYNAEELILICARKDLNDELIKKAEGLMREGLDWERFYRLAMKSGAAVLIHNSLRRIDFATYIPQYVFDKLRSAYLYALSTTARQHQESTNLLKLLYGENIAAIPLKGTFLSKRIYGYIESRGASVDIDIFVRWEDRNRTHKILTENGYRFCMPEEIEQWLWQENWISPKSQIVDILYDIWLRGFFKEAVAGLWDEVVKVTDDNGLTYYKFEDEELLIYMSQCLITSDNGYKCLKYASDINEFLNHYGFNLNWDSVTDKAKRWRLQSSLYTAVSLANDLFDNNIPLSVINRIRPYFFKRIFIRAFFNRKVMLKENFRRRLMDKFLSYIFFELIESRTFQEYLCVIKRVIIPPKEIFSTTGKDNLGSSYYYGRYITRFFRGFVKLLRF